MCCMALHAAPGTDIPVIGHSGVAAMQAMTLDVTGAYPGCLGSWTVES